MKRAKDTLKAISASLAALPAEPQPRAAPNAVAAIGDQVRAVARLTGEAYQQLKAELEQAVAEGRMITGIDPALIDATPWRDRDQRSLGDAALADLARSIREHGQLSPVALRRKPGGRYEIMFGHRRVHACRQLGIEARAVVLERDDRQLVATMLVENRARRDLSPMEQALHYQGLLEAGLFSRADLAGLLGVTRQQIHNTLQLTRLPEAVVAALGDTRELSLSVGKRLAETLERQGGACPPGLLQRIAQSERNPRQRATALIAALQRPAAAAIERSILIQDRHGRRHARLGRSGNQLVLRFQPELDPDVLQRVARLLPELYERERAALAGARTQGVAAPPGDAAGPA